MSGFRTAPPPRWVGVVGAQRPLSGQSPVRKLYIHARRADMTRLFPSLRDELPWWERQPDGTLADRRNALTIHAVWLRG